MELHFLCYLFVMLIFGCFSHPSPIVLLYIIPSLSFKASIVTQYWWSTGVKMQLFNPWMVSMATTIFTSSSKEGGCEHGNRLHKATFSHVSLCLTSGQLSPWTCPSTDLVSTWGPCCRGNSHLCILADWPLVSHSWEGSSFDLRGCTGIKTWEKKDLDLV